jgi:DNA-binding response OmpR family regulator
MTEQRTAVVVEDDADIRMLVLETLQLSGFVVHEAPTGREGIALVREVKPDLV